MSKTSITVTFTLDQLTTELYRLAPGRTQSVMVPHLVSSLEKQQPFMNHELLLREIVSIVSCISDRTFPDQDQDYVDMGRSRGSRLSS